eukprot:jgi/Mesvir1/9909/Mv18623-RA.1
MAMNLDTLSYLRSSKVYTTAIVGDDNPNATVRNLELKSLDSIVLKPNGGLGAHALKRFKSSEPGEGPGCRLGARWGARSPHSGPPPRKWQSPEGGRQSAKKKRPEYGDKEVAQ